MTAEIAHELAMGAVGIALFACVAWIAYLVSKESNRL